MSNIVFLGDSFCSHSANNDKNDLHPCQFYEENIVCWPDVVAKKFKKDQHNHGYGGTSWWYSYKQLRLQIIEDSDMWANTDHMVICLGNRSMPKIDNLELINKHQAGKFSDSATAWADESFNVWAYEKYVEEIIEWSKTRKIVVFYNFRHECWVVDKLKQHMPVCFTPLMILSHAETGDETGSIEYVQGIHANHLNSHNNQALARQIIHQFAFYKPGVFQINKDLYDLKNSSLIDQWVKDYRQILEEVYNNKI